jgi:hypothetical protein
VPRARLRRPAAVPGGSRGRSASDRCVYSTGEGAARCTARAASQACSHVSQRARTGPGGREVPEGLPSGRTPFVLTHAGPHETVRDARFSRDFPAKIL